MSLRVALVSAYHGGSHRAWAEGLVRHSRHRIHCITHEPQAWTWRLTGGFVTLGDELRAWITATGRPDIVVATSMVDLAGLLGIARRELGGAPAALYMHENQITQPNLGRARVRREHALVSWTSLFAADSIAWNSEFHRDAVADALPGFLGWYPDRRHDQLMPQVMERSVVLPVGVDLARLDPPRARRSGPPLILWNHRWDEDKDPAAALGALVDLAREGLEFRVALAGERFVDQRDRHAAAIAELGGRVVTDAHLPASRYRAALRSADIVLSTAHHEFFGISVVEAMYAGAFPVLPHRQVYPERIPARLHGRCLFRSGPQLRERLRWAITHPLERAGIAADLRRTVAGFDWSDLIPRYDRWLEETAGRTTAATDG